MNSSKTQGLFTSFQTTRSKTVNSFRINPEFTFKDKDIYGSFYSKDFKEDTNKFGQTHKLQMKIKVSKSLKGIKKVVDKYSSLKTNHQKLTKLTERKDEELELLNENIQELIEANHNLKYQIQVESSERNELEQEQRSIADYCNDLKRKFNNIEKTIDDYEQIIGKLQNGNIELQENYDNKIAEFENENTKLNIRLNDRVKIVKAQVNTIRDLELKSEYIIKDTQEQRNVYLERQMISRLKYEELEKKYNDAQKKIFEIQMGEDVRKIETRTNKKKISHNKSLNDSVKFEIESYDRRNNKLVNDIKDISIKVKKLEAKDLEKSNKSSRRKY